MFKSNTFSQFFTTQGEQNIETVKLMLKIFSRKTSNKRVCIIFEIGETRYN